MVVREDEWVVAVNDGGEMELVQAKRNGFLVLHSFPCLTEELIGARYGECFDMENVRGSEKEALFEKCKFVSRYGDKWETKRFERGQKKRKKAQKESRKRRRDQDSNAAEDNAEEDNTGELEETQDGDDEGGIPLFRPVKIAPNIGVYKSSKEELEQQRMELIERLAEVESDLGLGSSLKDESAPITAGEMKTNKNIFANLANQKLTSDEINAMKQNGVDVKDLVTKLTENNVSFNEMTEYAKEKYREKKTKKFSRKFRILQANAQTLANTMWDKDTCSSFKLGSFRPMDCIPQLLGLANIQSGSRVLIVESVWGLLAGAVLERLGGKGKLCVGYVNQEDPTRMIEFFNFSDDLKRPYESLDLSALLNGNRGDENGMILKGKFNSVVAQQELNKANAKNEGDGATKDSEEEILSKVYNSLKKRIANRSNDFDSQREQFRSVREDGFDSILLASKFEPRSALLALFPFLKPGSPFAVFSENLNALAQARMDLMEEAANMRLSETFYRIHQVLPGRTHPEMNMSGRSGYILSGVRVVPSAESKQSNLIKSNKFFRNKEAKSQQQEGADSMEQDE